jgi:hypothetical protein
MMLFNTENVNKNILENARVTSLSLRKSHILRSYHENSTHTCFI